MRTVWFLTNAEDEFIISLTQMLSAMVLAPYEIASSAESCRIGVSGAPSVGKRVRRSDTARGKRPILMPY